MLQVLQAKTTAMNATGELLPRGLKDDVFGLFFTRCVCTEMCVTLKAHDAVLNVSGFMEAQQWNLMRETG